MVDNPLSFDPMVGIRDSMMSVIGAQAAREHAKTAGGVFERVFERVLDFEKALSPEFDVGLRVTSLGDAHVFAVTGMGYMNPNLLIFQGIRPDKSRVELIQHQSQLSFLLIALKRDDSSKARIPIGFISPEK